MKQKIRYRITTSMGIWLAWNRLEDIGGLDEDIPQHSRIYNATPARIDNGKYAPLVLATFNCDHVVEYLGKSLLIETRDDTSA